MCWFLPICFSPSVWRPRSYWIRISRWYWQISQVCCPNDPSQWYWLIYVVWRYSTGTSSSRGPSASSRNAHIHEVTIIHNSNTLKNNNHYNFIRVMSFQPIVVLCYSSLGHLNRLILYYNPFPVFVVSPLSMFSVCDIPIVQYWNSLSNETSNDFSEYWLLKVLSLINKYLIRGLLFEHFVLLSITFICLRYSKKRLKLYKLCQYQFHQDLILFLLYSFITSRLTLRFVLLNMQNLLMDCIQLWSACKIWKFILLWCVKFEFEIAKKQNT